MTRLVVQEMQYHRGGCKFQKQDSKTKLKHSVNPDGVFAYTPPSDQDNLSFVMDLFLECVCLCCNCLWFLFAGHTNVFGELSAETDVSVDATVRKCSEIIC